MRHRPVFALAFLGLCALLLLLPIPAPAEDVVATTRIPLPQPLPEETDWYGIYQRRTKVGWAVFGIEKVGEGDDAVYVGSSRVEATLTGFGTLDFRFDTKDVFRAKPPFELLRSREHRKDGSVDQRLELDRQEDGTYVARIRRGEEVETRRFPDLDYTLADRLSHVHWAMVRPKVGDVLRVREFDITELRHDVYTYVVKAEHRWPARGVDVTAFEIPMRSERLGPIGTLWIDAEGRMLKGPLARDLAEMRAEPERQATELRFASDLFGFGRTPLNHPIGNPRTIRHLVLAAYGRGAEGLAAGPRQAIGRDTDGAPLILLGDGVEGADAATDAEVAAARSETPPPAAVRALAVEATAGLETDAEKVRALLHFVNDHLEDVHLATPYPVADLLVEKVGDARDHARLFVALARALDIPTREVYGLVYLGDEAQALGGHAWCEVALDGRWVPVDPTWVQMPVDATHLAITRDGDWMGMLAGVRRLQFERRSVQHGR